MNVLRSSLGTRVVKPSLSTVTLGLRWRWRDMASWSSRRTMSSLPRPCTGSGSEYLVPRTLKFLIPLLFGSRARARGQAGGRAGGRAGGPAGGHVNHSVDCFMIKIRRHILVVHDQGTTTYRHRSTHHTNMPTHHTNMPD